MGACDHAPKAHRVALPGVAPSQCSSLQQRLAVASNREHRDDRHQAPFDLVLLDLLLPDMDGWAILQQIREIRPSSRVVILCADVDAEGTIEAFRLGAVDVLLKPPDVDKLLRFLDEMTGGREDEQR